MTKRTIHSLSRGGRGRGVTLTEMIVAVSITVMMLATIGIVFKSATEAANKANANNTIMQDLRAITGQMQQDFTGFRPDLPFAVVWEVHNFANGPIPEKGDSDVDLNDAIDRTITDIRYDRIVFFANGDFQTNDCPLAANAAGFYNSSISGNLAQIFYGQNEDYRTARNPESSQIPESALIRRFKIFTADNSTGWNQYYTGTYINPILPSSCQNWMTNFQYDWVSIMNTPISFWKNQAFINYQNYYFNGDVTDNNFSEVSMIRRPELDSIYNAIQNNIVSYSALSQLLLAFDVTDFKVELWFPGATEWFPNERDLYYIANPTGGAATLRFPWIAGNLRGFYWNAPDDSTPTNYVDTWSKNDTTYNINWRSELDIQQIAALPDISWTGVWPEAVKFTFTLYDKNRRHSPDGQTFSYVVRIPPRM